MKPRELFAWIGVVLILTAYSLSNFEVISLKSTSYLLMNLIGSVAVAYEAFTKKDAQPMMLNIVWAIIALIGIFRAF